MKEIYITNYNLGQITKILKNSKIEINREEEIIKIDKKWFYKQELEHLNHVVIAILNNFKNPRCKRTLQLLTQQI